MADAYGFILRGRGGVKLYGMTMRRCVHVMIFRVIIYPTKFVKAPHVPVITCTFIILFRVTVFCLRD